jgi:hypothetical protein
MSQQLEQTLAPTTEVSNSRANNRREDNQSQMGTAIATTKMQPEEQDPIRAETMAATHHNALVPNQGTEAEVEAERAHAPHARRS